MCTLVPRLKLRHCLPNDMLILAGEIGKEMYFLQKGVVEILKPDGVPAFHLGGNSLEQGKEKILGLSV